MAKNLEYDIICLGDVHNRRLAARVVREKAAIVKLFDILGPRYK